MDVGDWLRSLGLGQYEAAFRESEIEADVLSELTDQHLKDLGVSLGHRLKMLRAIRELAGGAPVQAQPAALATVEETKPQNAAERRQLTVMFIDLVGSTELSRRLDPEAMRDVIRAYQNATAGEIKRFGGFVANFWGDGVLAYFGWPKAHENEAERAVRAGLAIANTISQVETTLGQPLVARVGIATGLVVVGELFDQAQSREDAAVGPTLALAARLQALAGPGNVIIAPSTRLLVGGLFDLADLGMHPIKGFEGLIRVWRVIGERPAESRFDAFHGISLTPLFGREHEVGLLLDRFNLAKDGEGQVFLLSGEPGIGKSRIVRALREQLANESYTPVNHYCSPFHVNSAFYPVIELIEHAARFERGDSPERRLDKLEALLAHAVDNVADVAPLVAALLSIPIRERYPPLNLTPEAQKRQTIEVLIAQLAGLASRQPVIAVYEDVHWVDPSTLELLELVVERVQHLPVLAIITFRPEFVPPWTGRTHVTSLSLGRLARRQGLSMIGAVTGGRALPVEVLEQIVKRTDGVPLYIEELTKTLLESELVCESHGRYVMTGPVSALAIPTTLHDSLLERLDRLGSSKETAQIAAALGREFSYDLLAAVSQLAESELQDDLEQLTSAEIVFGRGRPPHATYSFKHALVQDAAYAGLLKRRRHTLHAQIARALEKNFSDTVESRPELVAHHLTMAGLHELAAQYWHRAGELALRRSAAREALAHFSAALTAVMDQAETQDRDQCELKTRFGLGTAISLVHGPSAPEYAEQYSRAVTLGRRAGDGKLLFKALWGSWFNKQNTGRGEQALAFANELVTVAQELADDGLLLEAYHARWASSHLAGDHAVVLADTVQGIALYNPARHHAHTYEYGGHDTGVCARAHNAITLWLTGFAEQAARMALETVDLGRRLRHPQSLSHGAWWMAVLRQLLGEPAACRELAELTLRIEREQGSGKVFMCPLLLGWVRFEEGEHAEGLLFMEARLANVRSLIRRFYFDYELLVFAQALLKSGAPERALGVVEEALEFIEASRNRLYEAEIHRLKGACLAALTEEKSGGAEQWFSSGIAIAKRQGAVALALRGATNLAALWGGQGKHAAARDLLAPIYGEFTEGFDTPDLKKAKALLDELRA